MERVDGKFMLKIAFCDDDLEILKELGILLDKYKKEKRRRPYLYGISESLRVTGRD